VIGTITNTTSLALSLAAGAGPQIAKPQQDISPGNGPERARNMFLGAAFLLPSTPTSRYTLLLNRDRQHPNAKA